MNEHKTIRLSEIINPKLIDFPLIGHETLLVHLGGSYATDGSSGTIESIFIYFYRNIINVCRTFRCGMYENKRV